MDRAAQAPVGAVPGPLLLRGARLGPGQEPTDVLLSGGTVAAVGPRAATSALRPAVVDLAGRWLLPGLWDEHVHFTQWALQRRRLDLSKALSAAQAAAAVRAHLDALRPPGGRPLVGVGFRDGLWPDVPTAALLDDAGRGTPVVLISGDLHCAWLSTSAAHLFGAAPVDGLVREAAAFAVTRRLGDLPQDEVDAAVADAAAAAATRGVVGVVDLEMAGPGAWTRRVAAGIRHLRVEVGVYPQHLEQALAQGVRTGSPLPGGEGLAVGGPFKVLIDGSLNTRTAACVDPYPDSSHGLMTVPADELLALLRRARGGGLLPAVHAIGDRAVTAALDAFEALAAGGPPPALRARGDAGSRGTAGRIEHAQLVARADLARFAALAVVASVQPEHAMDDRDVADVHWAGRTGRAFALRSLLDAGATLALGSDAPVAPLDPWHAIAAAVTRARDGRAPWHPEQALTVGEALAASSRGRVRVAAGQAADLVALDADPHAATGEQLRAMPVALTVLAGRPTHDGSALTPG